MDDVSSSSSGSRPLRSGRRPGVSGTRATILDAARRRFADNGYDRTSLRAIAADAGVDQALIGHFFGSKLKLFVTVMEPPFLPQEIMPRVLEGDRSDIGRRAARVVVALLEDPDVRGRGVGLLRAAASEPEAARMVRELVTRELWEPLAAGLGLEDADLRVNLVASQIVGLVMIRYILEAEPLALLSSEELINALAPTLQRYLVEPIS